MSNATTVTRSYARALSRCSVKYGALPVLVAAGAPPIARLRTEYGKNELPRLPVREGEHAFAWFASFGSIAEHDRYRAALADARSGWTAIEVELAAGCVSPPPQLGLAATARSQLRHVGPAGDTTLCTGGAHDFDVIAGTWDIVNRRLTARGVGCTEWSAFPSTSCAALYLGGIANNVAWDPPGV